MEDEGYRGGSTTPGAAGMNGAGEPNVPQYPRHGQCKGRGPGPAPTPLSRGVRLGMVGDMLTQADRIAAEIKDLDAKREALLKQGVMTKEAVTSTISAGIDEGVIAENVSYPIVIDGECRLITVAAGMTSRGERREWLVSRPA